MTCSCPPVNGRDIQLGDVYHHGGRHQHRWVALVLIEDDDGGGRIWCMSTDADRMAFTGMDVGDLHRVEDFTDV